MKIAILTDHFLPKSDGIVTRLCAAIHYFIKLGHEVHVFTVNKPPYQIHGVVIHNYPSFCLPFYKSRKISSLNCLAILKCLNEYKPDILHVINATFLSFPAYYYAWRKRCPLVGSIHTDYLTYLEYYKMPWLKPLVRQFIRLFGWLNDITVCPSIQFQKILIDLGIDRIAIWYKVVDTAHFHPKKYSSTMRRYLTQGHPTNPLVIYSGRLSAEKNLSILYRMITTLTNIRLAFIGDGPMRERLTAQFAGTPTFFTGHLQDEALAGAYACADLMIMPSRSETLGLAALEAMSSGCPVVAADAGGLREVVQHGQSGFLFDPENHRMMIDLIEAIIINPSLRNQLSYGARQEGIKWDWNRSSARLVKLYQTTINMAIR